MRAVEAEQLRAGRLIAAVAMRAGVVSGEEDVFALRRAGSVSTGDFAPLRSLTLPARLFHRDDERAFGQRQRLLDRLGQARTHAGIVLQAIDDNLDVVLDPAIELQIVGEPDHLAIDAGADEAALEHVGEQILVFALLAAHHRGEDKKARAFGQGEDARQDLLARLGGDGPAAFGTMALTDASVEDAEIVVNLGDGADGRAGIAPAAFC